MCEGEIHFLFKTFTHPSYLNLFPVGSFAVFYFISFHYISFDFFYYKGLLFFSVICFISIMAVLYSKELIFVFVFFFFFFFLNDFCVWLITPLNWSTPEQILDRKICKLLIMYFVCFVLFLITILVFPFSVLFMYRQTQFPPIYQ